jgi:selenocysteine lyase/cysteine desulfurase
VTFEEARAAFPVFERLAYLNAGTNGPLARATAEAMVAQTLVDVAEGRAGAAYLERVRGLRERVRGKLATLIAVPAENMALTTSTTNGCNIVLAGLGLGPEDEVVTTDEEHFGLLGPLHTSGARVRVASTRETEPERALERLLDAVGPRTRLLALSHVSWVTGAVLPVAELKTETGLPILVDGAQSGGAIAVDATPYDYYTVSGQKWPCGPDSTGGLYVREPGSLRVSAPSYLSQDGFDPGGAFEAKPGAARFDHGYLGATLLSGLEAALDAAPAWRFERARDMAARCRALLAERYEVVTPGGSTLVSFRPDGDPTETVDRLAGAGVVVREIPGSGLVRVSCGYWTSDGDLERLLTGLAT